MQSRARSTSRQPPSVELPRTTSIPAQRPPALLALPLPPIPSSPLHSTPLPSPYSHSLPLLRSHPLPFSPLPSYSPAPPLLDNVLFLLSSARASSLRVAPFPLFT